MTGLPFVSIIIPTINEAHTLPRLLRSLDAIRWPKDRYEVIIVDGGSTDRTRDIAARYGCRVIDNPYRLRGAGCRIGVTHARGDLIAFTDADCVVPPNWLDGLYDVLASDPRIASVGGPNITPPDDTSFAKTVGDVLAVFTTFGSRYGLTSGDIRSTYHNPGCNVLYTKRSIELSDNFDSSLVTCEDEELDYRIAQRGYIHMLAPAVYVYHYRRSTMPAVHTQAFRYAFGRTQAAAIHPSMFRWFHAMPLAATMTFAVAVAGNLSGGPVGSACFAVALGYMAGMAVLAFGIWLQYRRGTLLQYFAIVWLWITGWSLGMLSGVWRTMKDRYTAPRPLQLLPPSLHRYLSA